MSQTVLAFIEKMRSVARHEYYEEVGFFRRLFHADNPDRVILSPELYDRLKEEEQLGDIGDRVVLAEDGLEILRGSHAELDFPFVIEPCLDANFPQGYNPSFYGLATLLND